MFSGALALFRGSFKQRSKSERFFLLLVCSFPVVSVSVPRGDTLIYIVLALAGLWGGWQAITHADRQLKRWYLLLFLLFVLGALSLFYTDEIRNGAGRLERLSRLAFIPLIIGMMVRFRIRASYLLVPGLALAALSLFIQAVYQTFWLHHEIADGLYHKIVFGDMAMLVALLLFAATVTLLHGRARWMVMVVIVLALYASVMSATRGAWLMIPVAALVMIWLYRGRVSWRVWGSIAAAMLAVLLFLSIVRPPQVVGHIERGIDELHLFASDPSQASSWGARLNMWRNATLIWLEHPLLGTGIGDFKHDQLELVAQGRSLTSDILQYGHAHSIYFDTLASLGLVGLLLMVTALFIVPGLFFYREWLAGGDGQRRFAALSGLLTVTAFAVFGFSEGWLSRIPFVNAYVVYLALFTASLMGEPSRQE